jgi:NADH:ubiquinone oxidoreductase subunit F (NADH-binding)
MGEEPAMINNVETLATIPMIINYGAYVFRETEPHFIPEQKHLH